MGGKLEAYWYYPPGRVGPIEFESADCAVRAPRGPNLGLWTPSGVTRSTNCLRKLGIGLLGSWTSANKSMGVAQLPELGIAGAFVILGLINLKTAGC